MTDDKKSSADFDLKFLDTMRQVPVGITVLRGKDMIVEMANETYLQIVDKKEQDFVGRSLYASLPEVREFVEPLLNDVFTTGVPYHGKEFQVPLNRFGVYETTYFNFVYQPLRGDDGAVAGVIVIANDVTTHVVARNKINDAERTLRIAVEATNLGTFDWDYELNIFVGSARLHEIFGYFDGRGHTHQDLIDRLHPEDLPVRDNAIANAMVQGNLMYESRIVWGDGSIRWVKIYGKVVSNENNHIRIIGTAQDITDHKEFSEKLEMEVKIRTRELLELNQELMVSNNELAEFAYIASHDLQEPLRKIQTFISRILDVDKNTLSERSKDYFGRLLQSMERMRRLITDLLAYSSVNAQADTFEMVDLNVVLRSVVDGLAEQIETTGAKIIFQHLPTVRAVRFQAEQLFANVIGNAMKYSKESISPVINIEATEVLGENIGMRSADHGVTYHAITITDNGIGFPNEYNERIFQVFQRLHGRNEYEGTGIGLAICRKIMDNHRGFIKGEGRPNHGASFKVYFRS